MEEVGVGGEAEGGEEGVKQCGGEEGGGVAEGALSIEVEVYAGETIIETQPHELLRIEKSSFSKPSISIHLPTIPLVRPPVIHHIRTTYSIISHEKKLTQLINKNKKLPHNN